ncbi:hypothetical protein THIOKS1270008 [Thiocapsa sp. KS1]|nr:hypothetical protein THIOKS1270008 [Thiocapsa sp. KS1]
MQQQLDNSQDENLITLISIKYASGQAWDVKLYTRADTGCRFTRDAAATSYNVLIISSNLRLFSCLPDLLCCH